MRVNVSEGAGGVHFALLGTEQSLSYWQVGGTEAFGRRLAQEALAAGDQVDYVLLGRPNGGRVCRGKVPIRYVSSPSELARVLWSDYDHVLVFYLPAEIRLFMALMRLVRTGPRFHALCFSLSSSWLRRWCYTQDLRLRYSTSFSVAPSIQRYLAARGIPTVLLLPPVPDSYYGAAAARVPSDRVRVGYLGRVDVGKGTDVAMKVLAHLATQPGYEVSAMLYAWDSSSESLPRELDRTPIDIRWELYRNWSPALEERVCRYLSSVDVLLLPYRAQTRTIAAPLVLLEAMAAECVVVSTPVGDIPWICRDAAILLNHDLWHGSQVDALLCKVDLGTFRSKVRKRSRELGFRASSVYATFRAAVCGDAELR